MKRVITSGIERAGEGAITVLSGYAPRSWLWAVPITPAACRSDISRR